MSTKEKLPLSQVDKFIITGLIIAAAGVAIQIISGVRYPKVPPVFFILLIPAAMVAFGRWRWVTIIIILAGLFLIRGLFTSGASIRLLDINQLGGVGGCIGLWIQTIGDGMATIAAIIAVIQNYKLRTL